MTTGDAQKPKFRRAPAQLSEDLLPGAPLLPPDAPPGKSDLARLGARARRVRARQALDAVPKAAAQGVGGSHLSQDLIAKVFTCSREGMCIADKGAKILAVNRAFTEITGVSEGEALGRPLPLLGSGQQEPVFWETLWAKIRVDGFWQGELWARRKNGESFPAWLTISAVTGDTGEPTHYVACFSDITEKKRAEARMEYLALHDPLTGLPNRILFNERLAAAISLAHRRQQALGVLFLDLNGFKEINDTLGHGAGDHVLKEVAGRLVSCVRESDAVARFGGDEFVVMLNDLPDGRDAEGVAEKILRALQQPLWLADRDFHLSASIGIALFPDHGADGDALLAKADAAMYRAKGGSRSGSRIFRCTDVHADGGREGVPGQV
jgi:diguanylate cyclase (GGDEF)-like protein/PAS domain S-box-containing protein